MTGEELIQWIKDNKAENLPITYAYLSPWKVFEGCYVEDLDPKIIEEEKRVEL